MNFKQLEYLQIIAREGTVSGAAKKLFISQSALSQQLLRLEEEVGAPIFERGMQKLKPTYFGEMYLEYTRKILLEYTEASRLLQDMNNLEKGRVVVGLPSNRSLQLLPSLLPRFLKKYPGIELKIVEDVVYRLDEMILDGEIDFSIMVSPPSEPAFAFQTLVQEEIFLAFPPGQEVPQHGEGNNKYVKLSDFRREPFILMAKGHRLRTLAETLFEKSGIKPDIMMETHNVDLARRITAAGVGVCFCSELAAALNPLVNPPQYFSIGENGVFWDLGVVYHKDKYLSRPMKRFIEEVEKELASSFIPPM